MQNSSKPRPLAPQGGNDKVYTPAKALDLRGSEVLDVWSVREYGRLNGVIFEEKDAAHVYAAEEYRNRDAIIVQLTMTRAELNRLREYDGG